MDIEQLTKTQLILVALLVSFVTSIATGIATASLLEQAPPEVTRVIDRVVERTVETVTPTQGTVTERTVVIREDDLTSDSIASITSSSVRIYESTNGGTVFLGLGFAVSRSGNIVTSSSIVLLNANYQVRFSGGTQTEATVTKRDDSVGLALLEVAGDSPSVTPVSFADISSVKLGQSIIAVSGEQNNVSTGIISNISTSPGTDGTPASVTSLSASLSAASALPGTPLINLFGDVVAVKSRNDSTAFIPVSLVESFLSTPVSS